MDLIVAGGAWCWFWGGSPPPVLPFLINGGLFVESPLDDDLLTGCSASNANTFWLIAAASSQCCNLKVFY